MPLGRIAGVIVAVLAVAGLGLALGGLDRSDRSQPSFLASFDPSLLVRGAARDQIPAIVRPRVETPADAAPLLPLSSLVVGVERNGDARAYPTALLSLHEVVNDVVGGEPVAVTWCPLCQTALAFERRVGERVLTFGVSGLLYHANLVLYDRQTESLWSQLLGGAVRGPYRGTRLRPVPVVHTTWAEWLERYPRTRVLSIRQDALAEQFLEPYAEVGARGEELSNAPYASYVRKVSAWFRERHRGLQDGSRVLGLVVRGQAKAYPLVGLRRAGVVEDRLGGEPVVVAFDPKGVSASVFSRRVGSREIRVRLAGRAVVDRVTGARWDSLTGEPLGAGPRLQRLPATVAYWFAWRRFHPRTAIHRD